MTDHSVFVWAANLMSSHPILIWRSHALRHRDRPGRMFLPPRAGVVGSAAVPVATSATAQWADPAQALAFLDAHRQPGEDVFGGVRVVRRNETIHPPCSTGVSTHVAGRPPIGPAEPSEEARARTQETVSADSTAPARPTSPRPCRSQT